MEVGRPGDVYNLGSGRAVAIEEILTMLLGLSQTNIQVEQDPARMRPVDQPISYGAIDKIGQQLGWQPQIDLETSLKEILEYWRQQVTTTMTTASPEKE
jgi:GDP-4-dehydro-6-deoxy-D-mannose reductase